MAKLNWIKAGTSYYQTTPLAYIIEKKICPNTGTIYWMLYRKHDDTPLGKDWIRPFSLLRDAKAAAAIDSER